MIELNGAITVARVSGPEAGRVLLEPLLANPELANCQPLYAAQAELLRQSGDHGAAQAAYRRALELSSNAVERAELARRLAALGAQR